MEEFLKTGVLGPLKPGAPMAEAISFLGEPISTSGRKGWIGLPYCGTAVQVWCYRGKVYSIGFYVWTKTNPQDFMDKFGWEMPFDSKTTVQAFQDYLNSRQINWRVENFLPFGTRILVGQASVSAQFGEDDLLESIIVADRL